MQDCIPPLSEIPVTANPMCLSLPGISESVPQSSSPRSVAAVVHRLRKAVTPNKVEEHSQSWSQHLANEAPHVLTFLQCLGVPYFPESMSRMPLKERCKAITLMLWAIVIWASYIVLIFLASRQVDYTREEGSAQIRFYTGMTLFQLMAVLPNWIYVAKRLRGKIFHADNTPHLVSSLPTVRRLFLFILLLFVLNVPAQLVGNQSNTTKDSGNQFAINFQSSVISSFGLAFPLSATALVFLADVKAANEIVQRCVQRCSEAPSSLAYSDYCDAREAVKSRVREHNLLNGWMVLVAVFNAVAILIALFSLDGRNAAQSFGLFLTAFACYGKEFALLFIVFPAVAALNESSSKLSRTIGDSVACQDSENGQRILFSQLVRPVRWKVLGFALMQDDIQSQIYAFLAGVVLAILKLTFQPGESVI